LSKEASWNPNHWDGDLLSPLFSMEQGVLIFILAMGLIVVLTGILAIFASWDKPDRFFRGFRAE